MVDGQQIRVEMKIKKALDKKKLVPRETYSQVIERVLNEYELLKAGDKNEGRDSR